MSKSVDNPQFRSQRGRLGAYISWAKTEDTGPRALSGRRARLDRFEKQVDPCRRRLKSDPGAPPGGQNSDAVDNPEGEFTIRQRAKRAEYGRKAYYQRLAMGSAAARRGRKLICQRCGEPKDADAPTCPKCQRAYRER
jgi:hypothetical protein